MLEPTSSSEAVGCSRFSEDGSGETILVTDITAIEFEEVPNGGSVTVCVVDAWRFASGLEETLMAAKASRMIDDFIARNSITENGTEQ